MKARHGYDPGGLSLSPALVERDHAEAIPEGDDDGLPDGTAESGRVRQQERLPFRSAVVGHREGEIAGANA